MKIGYLLQYDAGDMQGFTAAELHVRAVVHGFQRRGHVARMLTLHGSKPHWSGDLRAWHQVNPGRSGSAPFRLIERGLRGVQSRLRLPYLNLFDSYRFAEACELILADCDVLYERYWLLNYGGLMAARRLGAPLILEVNGDLFQEYEEQGIRLSRVQWQALRVINRLLLAGADGIVTVSEPLRQRLLRRWSLDPNKVLTVPNGAHVELFAEPPDGLTVRREFGLGDEPLVIFVGSFQPWHGVDILINAFRLIAASHPAARLLLVGDGPARAEAQQAVSSLDLAERVLFTGTVQHQRVAALLNTADVAVVTPRLSPASMMNSPLKLFEYMAAGKAIVAPRAANVEGILSHGQNALLVPPDDPQALADALGELLAAPKLRQSLGATARQQALERHSWDRTISRLEQLMRDLIRTRRHSRSVGARSRAA